MRVVTLVQMAGITNRPALKQGMQVQQSAATEEQHHRRRSCTHLSTAITTTRPEEHLLSSSNTHIRRWDRSKHDYKLNHRHRPNNKATKRSAPTWLRTLLLWLHTPGSERIRLVHSLGALLAQLVHNTWTMDRVVSSMARTMQGSTGHSSRSRILAIKLQAGGGVLTGSLWAGVGEIYSIIWKLLHFMTIIHSCLVNTGCVQG